jgi:hypothetical protein
MRKFSPEFTIANLPADYVMGEAVFEEPSWQSSMMTVGSYLSHLAYRSVLGAGTLAFSTRMYRWWTGKTYDFVNIGIASYVLEAGNAALSSLLHLVVRDHIGKPLAQFVWPQKRAHGLIKIGSKYHYVYKRLAD